MSGAARPRAELEAIFRAALAAVDGGEVVRRAVSDGPHGLAVAGRPLGGEGRLLLLAAGKAAAPMARAFAERAGPRLDRGLVVTREGHGSAGPRCRLLEAGHPLPDARSEAAGRAALALVETARPEDVLVVLLSGGASSLLACPAAGLGLEDLRAATRLLLAAGADIAETNAVRKHLSALAGGRLAQRSRAGRVELLAISDVPGDAFDVIGSGPFSADPSRFADALAVLDRRRLLGEVPPAVRAHLEAGAAGRLDDTPGPGDPALAPVRATLLASNRTALGAGLEAARERGLDARPVAWPLEGEAREAGAALVALGRRARPERPLLLLAGGETTVTVTGRGRGGRNQELALAAALELDGDGSDTLLLAAGTDGSDGPTDAAGAFADPGSVARGRRAGVDARACLEDNDSYRFFRAEGGLLRTGPTGTNVMDLALLRIGPRVSEGRMPDVSAASKTV